jgi:hypothetical protein
MIIHSKLYKQSDYYMPKSALSIIIPIHIVIKFTLWNSINA